MTINQTVEIFSRQVRSTAANAVATQRADMC